MHPVQQISVALNSAGIPTAAVVYGPERNDFALCANISGEHIQAIPPLIIGENGSHVWQAVLGSNKAQEALSGLVRATINNFVNP